jgi:hypothetical protein
MIGLESDADAPRADGCRMRKSAIGMRVLRDPLVDLNDTGDFAGAAGRVTSGGSSWRRSLHASAIS